MLFCCHCRAFGGVTELGPLYWEEWRYSECIVPTGMYEGKTFADMPFTYAVWATAHLRISQRFVGNVILGQLARTRRLETSADTKQAGSPASSEARTHP